MAVSAVRDRKCTIFYLFIFGCLIRTLVFFSFPRISFVKESSDSVYCQVALSYEFSKAQSKVGGVSSEKNIENSPSLWDPLGSQ